MTTRLLIFTFLATSLLAAEPEKLTKLRSSYESAIAKATAPIQKTYTTELEKLKLEFTKAGKLEDALAVSEELKSLTSSTQITEVRPIGSPAPPTRLRSFKTVTEFQTWFNGTEWTNDDSEVVRFGETDFGVRWKDSPPLTPDSVLGRYNMTVAKVGEAVFQFPGGPDVPIRVGDDLKTLTIGQKKVFRRTTPREAK